MKTVNKLKCLILRSAFPALRCEEAELPKGDYIGSESFRRIAGCCRRGDAKAMSALSNYFLRLYEKNGERFFVLASNFWRCRSAVCGNLPAAKKLYAWAEAHPGEAMPVALDFEHGAAAVKGRLLRLLGFEDIHDELFYDLIPCFGGAAVFVRSYPNDALNIWEYGHYTEELRDSHLRLLGDFAFYYQADSGREALRPAAWQLVRLFMATALSRIDNIKEKLPGYRG